MEGTKKAWLSKESNKHGSRGFTVTNLSLHQVVGIYVYMLWLLCFCGTPNCGSRYISGSFAFIWESFPSFGLSCVASVCELLPCILLCLEGLLFSERECISREVKWGTAGRRKGRGTYSWDVLYERKINFQKRKRYITMPMLLKMFADGSKLNVLIAWNSTS